MKLNVDHARRGVDLSIFYFYLFGILENALNSIHQTGKHDFFLLREGFQKFLSRMRIWMLGVGEKKCLLVSDQASHLITIPLL